MCKWTWHFNVFVHAKIRSSQKKFLADRRFIASPPIFPDQLCVVSIFQSDWSHEATFKIQAKHYVQHFGSSPGLNVRSPAETKLTF